MAGVCVFLSSIQAQYFTSVSNGTITTDAAATNGGSWVDYDGDGDVDLYNSNRDYENNFLYRNDAGTFTRITTGVVVNNSDRNQGTYWADYDNDGDLDVYMCSDVDVNKLFYNDGTGNFTEVLTGSIVTDNYQSEAAAWADYDNDGLVDLFVANESNQDNCLYHNDGGGLFTRIMVGDIVNDGGSSHGAAWADYNNDGYPDLFVANESGQDNFLYMNNGTGTFTKILTGDIVNDGGDSMGPTWGDYNNDGHLDLFVSNYNGEVSFLYENNGDGTFTKITTGNVVTDTGYPQSSAWADINNDGHKDLIIGNSHSSSSSSCINHLYINNGNGTFTAIGGESLVTDTQPTSSLSLGDYNEDGFLDISATSNLQSNKLYLNNGNGNNWVNILLEGVVSNKSAIGAKVRVKANISGTDVWQYQEVCTFNGKRSQSSLNVEFGLGNASQIDSLIIEWPSGIVCYYTNVAGNTFYYIDETCNSLGINELIVGSISAFPNPFSNELYVDLTKFTGVGIIQLIDLTGRVVVKHEINRIGTQLVNVGEISQGVYLIKLLTENGIYTTKVIKE